MEKSIACITPFPGFDTRNREADRFPPRAFQKLCMAIFLTTAFALKL